jgi:histidine triad (HIT) family protein
MTECTYCTDASIRAREILRTDLVRAFPTNIPIVPGHMIVCPTRCVRTMDELSVEEREALFAEIARIKGALGRLYAAEGFNHAWNEGELAGQSIPHVHVHLLPRKRGDGGVTEYEPRKFLYRPGSRATTPEEELRSLADHVRSALEV